MARYYPIMLDVSAMRCVVIGGGAVAERKTAALLEAGAAHVVVIAPEATEGLVRLGKEGKIRLERRRFAACDAAALGADLVIAASSDRALNRIAAAAAKRAGALVNVVDDAAAGSFVTPAVVRRGELVIAVSASGASPALSARIARELEQRYGAEYERSASLLKRLRERLATAVPDRGERQRLLRLAAEEAPHHPDAELSMQAAVDEAEVDRAIDRWIERLRMSADKPSAPKACTAGKDKEADGRTTKMADSGHDGRTIVVGTRQSALALTQTGQVVEELRRLSEKHGFNYKFEIKKIVTKGDRILDVTLSKVGGKGLFVKEIEQALLDGEIDMAVHSMKDMPYQLPAGLTTGAVPKRIDPRDCLISNHGGGLAGLPRGAKVGTSSLRRSSQLKHARPDLRIEWIRGNIDSRIRKLETEGFDAIVLAAAGLTRMGWEDRISATIPEDICLPAVGQGALGIECRDNDREVLQLLALLNDKETELAVRAERAFLGALNGGCQVPIGAYAVLVGSDGTGAQLLELTGMVGTPDGMTILKDMRRGTDPEALGQELAESLRASGADRLLAEFGGGTDG